MLLGPPGFRIGDVAGTAASTCVIPLLILLG
jgi:hypothetical protein